MEEEKFPVGMRVLVVDDDPTCLKLIENLLHKCQYNVTTTSRARDALRMLKENRNRFDIVITDVHMPDMDGIKLLQHVGLDMDLPVIILSAYGETKEVMRGIRNGACDFLLKPVRIQELQNIWQHVVRKKKSFMQRKPRPIAADEDGERAPPPRAPSTDQEGSPNQRGTEDNGTGDDNDEEDDDLGGSGRENEEPTTKKKSRLFWSVELHQKFVDAVNQLGQDKAYPKKILDLMNVEGLTREKVASHLQKYRLYLKKMNSASSQATKRAVGLAAEDAHIRSLGLGGGYGVFRSLAGSGGFSGATTTLSHGAGGLVGQLNAAAGLSMRGLSSSAMLQRSQFPNSTNSLTALGNFQPAMSLPAIQNGSSLFQNNLSLTTQGFPPTLQQNNFSLTTQGFATTLQQNNVSLTTQGFPTTMQQNNVSLTTQGFPATLQQNNVSLLYPSATSSMMVNQNQAQNMSGFGNQSSFNTNTSNMGAFGGIGGSSAPLLNSLQPSVQSHPFQPNPVPGRVSYNGISQATAPMQNNIHDDALDIFCGISSLEEAKANLPNQDSLGGVNNANNLGQPQSWQDQRPDYILNSCNLSSASSTLITAPGPFDQQTLNQNNNGVVPLPYNQIEGATSNVMQQVEVQKANGDSSLRFNDNYLLDDTKLLGGSSPKNSEYLEDIVGRFLKQENGEMGAEEEDFDLDSFTI